MPRLLVVHHTPSPAMQELLEAVLIGARHPDLTDAVEVQVRPALSASISDVLAADGFLLGTPANLGYMSGALKHFFDQIYYPCLDAQRSAPYGLWVHGSGDVTGAVRAVHSIAHGVGWRPSAPDVTSIGIVDRAAVTAATELGATVAAVVAEQVHPKT